MKPVARRPPPAFTEAPPLRLAGHTGIVAGGRRWLYFAGCDYLRFSRHPAILRAVRAATRPGCWNVAASRLTTGNDPRYAEAEARVADFFGAPEALLVSTGYVTNLVVAQALAGEVSHVLLDERAHVCLLDAAALIGVPVRRFAHRDVSALTRVLQGLPAAARPLVMTDGMFARDGAVAPLTDYLAALPVRGWLLVDDAHGAGTLGARGRGTPEHCEVRDKRLIQTLTFSKAFGAYCGAVVCPPGLRVRLVAGSRLFGGSTPPPLPLVAGVARALEVMREEGSTRRRRMQVNAAFLHQRLAEAGRPMPSQPGPVFPVFPLDAREQRRLRRRLEAAGVYPSFIRYPGGPAEGYFRFVVSSAHTRPQLARLAEALRRE